MKGYEVRLYEDAERSLTFQDYARPPEIAGVWTKPLKKHRSENGRFMEHLRLDGGDVEGLKTPYRIRQVSMSHAAPGRINAFHVYPKRGQNELWTVAQGQLLVWAVDCREDSETRGVKRSYLLSGEEPSLLYLPGGVAHGYKSGPQGATLLYAMDQQFDLGDPDEGRLPWDFFGEELWAEDRG
jgi:dTDP-4-dehydrorhamnose 3,5-epimerase